GRPPSRRALPGSLFDRGIPQIPRSGAFRPDLSAAAELHRPRAAAVGGHRGDRDPGREPICRPQRGVLGAWAADLAEEARPESAGFAGTRVHAHAAGELGGGRTPAAVISGLGAANIFPYLSIH